MAKNLAKDGIAAEAIHGNKAQNARQRALNAFRNGQVRVLVATDIVARGIDVPGVTHIINYDLPDEPENYVHRIGRTGRNGADGIAITLCAPDEVKKLRAVEKITRTELLPGGVRGTAPAQKPGRGRSAGPGRNPRPPKGGGHAGGHTGGHSRKPAAKARPTAIRSTRSAPSAPAAAARAGQAAPPEAGAGGRLAGPRRGVYSFLNREERPCCATRSRSRGRWRPSSATRPRTTASRSCRCPRSGRARCWSGSSRPASARATSSAISAPRSSGATSTAPATASRRSPPDTSSPARWSARRGRGQKYGLALGDMAVSEQIVPCWNCRYCLTGKYWMCAVHDIYGFRKRTPGAMAEYVRFPAGALNHKVPPGIPAHHAAFIEPLACSIHAVQRGDIEFQDVVVIAGAGPLGLGMSQRRR